MEAATENDSQQMQKLMRQAKRAKSTQREEQLDGANPHVRVAQKAAEKKKKAKAHVKNSLKGPKVKLPSEEKVRPVNKKKSNGSKSKQVKRRRK